MRLGRLWLRNYRNYRAGDLEPAPSGLTLIEGGNGDGKTNLLEAVAFLATLSSFRGAPPEALVRHGCSSAVVRGSVERGGSEALVEVELDAAGRHRVLVNRKPLRRSRDLFGVLRVTVFGPDDLALVKGGPAGRRRFLDELLVALRPANDELRADVDRILRQRNALLKQMAGGRSNGEAASTLEVWDTRLATAGEALAAAREDLVTLLEPHAAKAYGQVAGDVTGLSMRYCRSWEGPLSSALAVIREEDLRRAVTMVGPHRDELALFIRPPDPDAAALHTRTHASQGEQRSLALALRLGAHALVTDMTGSAPVLLLDDVFSELDAGRSAALVAHLPDDQALLTTTGPLPTGAVAERTVRVREGRIW